ncbi:MAG TPA: thiamine phosphate synthase [Vicinamibacterales bacterium]
MIWEPHESPSPHVPNPKSRFPTLNAIVDVDAARAAGWAAIEVARACIAGGGRFLQVRAKQQPGAAFLELARAVVALARPSGAIVIVNDRADIAKLAGADGVHLGQEDLSPSAARAILGPFALIGRSTHSLTQIEAAATEPVDYLAIGPVFETTTKATGYDAVGLEMVAKAASTGCPVVAIGGIKLHNARSAIAAGATSVALISDLLVTGDPARRTTEFLDALGTARR